MISKKYFLKKYKQINKFLQKKTKVFNHKKVLRKRHQRIGLIVVAVLIVLSTALFSFDVFSQEANTAVLDMSLSADNYDSATKTFTDRSGSNNDGVSNNSAVFESGRYGSVDGAMSFNGVSDYVEVPDDSSLNPSDGSFTISFWIKVPDWDGSIQNVIIKSSGTGANYQFNLHSGWDGNCIFWFQDDRVYGNQYVYAGFDATDGDWHHIVGLIDREAEEFRSYSDGDYYNRRPFSNFDGYLNNITNSAPLNFGNAEFEGLIEDVRIYNYALTDQEVQDMYESEKVNYSASSLQKGLVGYWSMDKDEYIEGTENLAPYTDYSDRNYNQVYNPTCWGGDGATIEYFDSGGYNDMPYKKLIKTDAGTGGCYHNNNQYFDIENNTTYIISAYIKANRNQSFNGHLLNINRPSDNRYKTSSGFDVTTEWQRYYWVYNSSSDDAGTYHTRHIIYIDDNLPLEVYWSGFQIEKKSDITPYVNGIRVGRLTEKTPYSNHGYTGMEQSFTFSEDRFGNSGGAMSFDGDADRINAGNKSSLDITEEITLEAWVKPTSYNIHFPIFIRKGDNYRIGLQGVDDGQVYFRLILNGVKQSIGSNAEVPIGEWTHVVGTYDGTYMTIYINGEIDGGPIAKSGLIDLTTEPLIIGAYNIGGSYCFDGQIDDVRVYNRALSELEIQSLYDSHEPKISAGSLNKGLIGQWSMDEEDYNSSTNRLTDKTPYSNHGTNNGATLTTGKDGQANTAMSFNGVDNYVDIGDLGSVSNWTMSYWMYSNIVEDYRNPLHTHFTGSSNNQGVRFEQYTGGLFKVGVSADNTWRSAGIVSNLTSGKWYHVTAVGDKTNNNLKVYLNGVKELDKSHTSWPTNFPSINIGRGFSTSSYRWFNGLIDNVRIYNRTLSEIEVESLYDQGANAANMTVHPE